MINLRPPARSPSPESDAIPLSLRDPVRILHPAYPDGSNVLLSFPAVDTATTSDPTSPGYGVHQSIVFAACCIIAGNRLDGWLSKDAAGVQPIDRTRDHVLQEQCYWLHLPHPVAEPDTDPYRYPIVPTFRQWRYPSEPAQTQYFSAAVEDPRLATRSRLSATAAVRDRDRSCRLSADSEGVERAHLVPSQEEIWFRSNFMSRHAPVRLGHDALNSEYNAILLREDLHTQFDRMLFSLVPKPDDQGNTCLVAHINTADTPGLYKTLHNKRLRPIRGVAPQYLHARFAWDIFPQLRSFLQGGQPRLLTVRQENGDIETREFSGKECARFCEGQGRGRSYSPTKRKRSTENNDSPSGSLDSAVAGFDTHHESEDTSEDELETERRQRRRAVRAKHWAASSHSRSPSPQRGRKRRRSASLLD